MGGERSYHFSDKPKNADRCQTNGVKRMNLKGRISVSCTARSRRRRVAQLSKAVRPAAILAAVSDATGTTARIAVCRTALESCATRRRHAPPVLADPWVPRGLVTHGYCCFGATRRTLRIQESVYLQKMLSPFPEGVIHFRFTRQAWRADRSTERPGCGASGHPARCTSEAACQHPSHADCGQDARRPHRRDALCHAPAAARAHF